MDKAVADGCAAAVGAVDSTISCQVASDATWQLIQTGLKCLPHLCLVLPNESASSRVLLASFLGLVVADAAVLTVQVRTNTGAPNLRISHLHLPHVHGSKHDKRQSLSIRSHCRTGGTGSTSTGTGCAASTCGIWPP